MSLKQKLTYFIDRTFHNEIISIKPPVEWLEVYRDIGVRVEGYAVPIVRKYSGEEKILFPIDYGMFGFISAEQAAQNAKYFYDKVVQKLEKRDGKTK